MKHFIVFIALSLVSSVYAQETIKMQVCVGDIDGQAVTLVNDNNKLIVLKGEVDISKGNSGNSVPKEAFGNKDLLYAELPNDQCDMTVDTGKGSFILTLSCEGVGEGTITEFSIPSLELSSASFPVTCRAEEYLVPAGRERSTLGSRNRPANNQ